MAKAEEMRGKRSRGAVARFVGVPAERLRRAAEAGEVVRVVNLDPSGARRYDTVRFCGEIERLARAGRLEPHLVAAASRLADLHHAARFPSAGAVDPAKVRVDGSAAADPSGRALDAREAFAKAMRVLGPLARAVVWAVVIDGRTLAEAARMNDMARNRRDGATAALWVLKAGLDNVAEVFGFRWSKVSILGRGNGR